jgi:beta-lactamase class A
VEYREEILKFLTKTAFEDWLPAGLPVDTRVAHKIGKDIGTFSDGGIVFAQKPFVLVIMSKNARESEANEALPKITKIVWEFENSK